LEGPLLLTRYRLEIKYSLLIVALLGGLIALDRVDAFAGLDRWVSQAMDTMSQFGIVGMFLIAIIGNSSLLIQVPYTVPLVSIALNGAGLEHLLFLGLGAGIGAGIGEIISYLIADKVLANNPDLPKSSLYQWVDQTVKSHPRSTPWIIFVWAASFLPDDTVLIPLAMIKYGLRRVAFPLFMGKVTHNLLFALALYLAADEVSQRVSNEVQTDLALGILIVFVLIILYQVEKAKAAIQTAVERSPTIDETL
jgi:membrane protein DedA with SNARE-associated domain